MNLSEYGFLRTSEEILPRIERLVNDLTTEQQDAFRALSEHLDVYYQDAKKFLAQVVEDEASNRSVSAAQRRINIVLAATHVTLRAQSQFGLAMSEIIKYGSVQGELPVMETDRIIRL